MTQEQPTPLPETGAAPVESGPPAVPSDYEPPDTTLPDLESVEPPGGPAGSWATQLQGMIDNLSTQAAPALREIAAKAAELAARAGEAAGPLARRAAGVTEQVGHRVAERSQRLAADLRRASAAPEEGSSAQGEASESPGTEAGPTEPPGA